MSPQPLANPSRRPGNPDRAVIVVDQSSTWTKGLALVRSCCGNHSSISFLPAR